MPQLEKLWRPFAFLLFNVPPIPSLVETVVSAVIVGCCSIHIKLLDLNDCLYYYIIKLNTLTSKTFYRHENVKFAIDYNEIRMMNAYVQAP